ncbi:AP-1 complex-associated regulatory protein isoform X2 [Callorhinchus milii]|nr:AP-1 complex-associated regulatory protein isoform X2 [Callorhinchus milii]|eukprot:gi/632958710/ref/XP_007895195.1/ PREDICTED: AP-1 complex-associated regulatory protein isoform X3 [Callorhinchus milii]
MGNCWAQCFGLFRKEANRIQRGGGSKYFRSSAHGEHFTIEFENLVESDEGESPGANPRPISEDEIQILQNRHYDSIAERQGMVDSQLQTELAAQEEQLRIEEEAFYNAQREAARAAKQKRLLEQQRLQKMKRRAKVAATPDQQKGDGGEEDFESYLQNAKSQSEAFRNQCRINRLIPMRERSKTEEDILQAALRHSSRRPGSNPMSASDESTGLEWENDFVSAELDDNGNSEYAGFVNPVLELSPSDVTTSESDQQG